WLVHPHLASLKTAQVYAAHTDSFCKKGRQMNVITQLKKTEAQKLSAEVAVLQKKFFNLESAQLFFTELETIATQNGVSITSLKLLTENADKSTPSVVQSGISTHRAALSVIGKFDSIVNMIKQISQYNHKLTVSDVALSAKNARVECSMIISIYVIEQGGTK
ncbi:MAG: hypothetical protein ABFC56_08965, partial [Clostridiaceae bacterium]